MTGVNKAELRRLAEAAQFGGGAHEDIEFSNQLDFHAGCTPAAVLSLLDECDRKDSLLEEYKRGGRCALELLEDADAERDAALAELEALRKDAERYRDALAEVAAQVDGNIRVAVRDCVNFIGDVQDIYGYCDQIDVIIDCAIDPDHSNEGGGHA